MTTTQTAMPHRPIRREPGLWARGWTRHVLCSTVVALFLPQGGNGVIPPRTLAQGGLIQVASAAEAPRQASFASHRDPFRTPETEGQRRLARARFLAAEGDRAGALRIYRSEARSAPAPGFRTPRSPTARTRLRLTHGDTRSGGGLDLRRTRLGLVDDRLGLEGLGLELGSTLLRRDGVRIQRHHLGAGLHRAWNARARWAAHLEASTTDDSGESARAQAHRGDHASWGLRLGTAVELPRRSQLWVRLARRPADTVDAARDRVHRLEPQVGLRWRPRASARGHLTWTQGILDDGNRSRRLDVAAHGTSGPWHGWTTATWIDHDRPRPLYASDTDRWAAGTGLERRWRRGAWRGHVRGGLGMTAHRDAPTARTWAQWGASVAWADERGSGLELGWVHDERTWLHDHGTRTRGWTLSSAIRF